MFTGRTCSAVDRLYVYICLFVRTITFERSNFDEDVAWWFNWTFTK